MFKRFAPALLSLGMLVASIPVSANSDVVRRNISKVILCMVDHPTVVHPYDAVIVLVKWFRELLNCCYDAQLAALCTRLENAVDVRESAHNLLSLLSQATGALEPATQERLQNLSKQKQLCLLHQFKQGMNKPQGSIECAERVLLGK